MKFRLSWLALPVVLLPVAACGPAHNEFAPPCPAAALVPALADLTRFASDHPGGGRDLTDLVVQARVIRIDGSCAAGSAPDNIDAKVQVSIAVQRGPAMSGREADVPVFVAVTKDGDVRDKQILPVHVVFPANVDRLNLTSPVVDLMLPVSASVTGAAYKVIAGFQLTPDELAANRQANGG